MNQFTSNSDVYVTSSILPEFNNLSNDLRLALYDVYNRSFKEIAQAK